MLSYGLGFAKYLQQQQHSVFETAKFGGASGGSLIAAMLASNVDANFCYEFYKEQIKKFEVQRSPFGKMTKVLDETAKLLPENVHQILNEKQNLLVSVTDCSTM